MAAPRGGWKLSSADERNRRSVYIFVRRNSRYPMLEAFDMPDTHESCPRRDVTTTAPQALTMLNDKVALEWAQAFAGRARWPRRTRWIARSDWPTRGRPIRGRRTPSPRSSTSSKRDRRACGEGREAGAAPGDSRRASTRHTPRRSWISARCC